MKVLLINPPRLAEIAGNNPAIIEEQRGFNPPLGLLYIAAFLEKSAEHEVRVLDSQVEKLGYDGLKQRIADLRPDIVGITAMTLTLIDVLQTAATVKEINPDTIVVLGGPHVNLFPEETIRFANVDYLVLGEGEEVFRDLVAAIDKGGDPAAIKGVFFLCNGGIVNTGSRPHIENLDALPFPARHLVPYRQYTSLLSKGKVVTTIITSRGCPYQCAFCDRPSLGKKFRARSAVNIVDELEECVQMGIQEFLFYDDTFTVSKKRVLEVCREIVRRRLTISWDIRARVDTVDEEMLAHLRRAGCSGIHYGVEAGTEKILKVLNKGISLAHAATIFKLTRRQKIQTLAYFMIGNPTETIADIQATFRMMKRLNPDYVHLTILTPFPGTRIYLDGLKSGRIEKDWWREFARNPRKDFMAPHWNEFFTKEELNRLLVKGYRSFYLRPNYILRRIWKLHSFRELKTKAAAGVKVLRMR
ncbi:MAG: B12-binding domain-containing radical SAM protein [Thermodesulfobacteriota bacterium]